jgi:hypothetical protein
MQDPLAGLAALAIWYSDYVRAARLLGATTAIRYTIGGKTPLQPHALLFYKEALARLETSLDPTIYVTAQSEGQRLPLDEVIARAMEVGE